jgi:hypothetical protein
VTVASPPPPSAVRPQSFLSERSIDLNPTPWLDTLETSAFPLTPPQTMIYVTPQMASSVWFKPAFTQFQQLLTLKTGWDSYDGERVLFSRVERALSFLGTHLEKQSLPPTVVPLSDGGVQLVWHDRGLDVEATFSATEAPEVFVRDLATGDEFETNLDQALTRDRLREIFRKLA